MAEHNHSVGCGACEEMLEREKAERLAATALNRSTYEYLLVITHDLRGRLNAITGWAGILRSQLTGDDAVSERAIVTIERNAWAQARLIDELLARVEGREAPPAASEPAELDAQRAQRR